MAEDAGERLPCPRCGTVVLAKSMIPILAEDDPASHRYVCTECARAVAGLPPLPVKA